MMSGKFILQESASTPDHIWIIIGIMSFVILLILIFNAIMFCYPERIFSPATEYRFHERSDRHVISVTESHSEESTNSDDMIV